MTQNKAKLLVVDDDLDMQDLLRDYYEPRGFSIEVQNDPNVPLAKLNRNEAEYNLIITDLKMPHLDGLQFVERVKKIAPELPIVLITAHGTVETAVKAIQVGAYDFVEKPINFPKLNVTIERALRHFELQKENQNLRREVQSGRSMEGVIGKSSQMRNILELARRVANSTANILIQGESGTGKEVIAKAIHNQSGRKDKPFTAINCSAIPENLLESELFGHAKGSFTGASEKKIGLFEEAEGGTLFLDEIGDMNVALQAKLLRVLQERKIKRIGENQYRSIDVRIISATHKDLKTAVAKQDFREDLYYRLCVIPIHIAPLRERTEDIIPLAQHFLDRYRVQNGSEIKGFTKGGLDLLEKLTWRGNVRELENVVERAAVLCDRPYIDVIDLPAIEAPREIKEEAPAGLFESQVSQERLPTLHEFSQRYVQYVLHATGGVKEKAARILGIDRKTLYRKNLELQQENPAPSNWNPGLKTGFISVGREAMPEDSQVRA